MPSPPEPRNPFYALLMVACLLFIATVLAVAVIPVLEQKASDAGEPPPPSAWRDALREQGWIWLLYQVAAVVVFALASMALDRYRRLRSDPPSTTIPHGAGSSPAAADSTAMRKMDP